MYGDKEFDGVGYPTPSSIPLENSWRTAKIPADAAWQGVFMGVLETLTDENNWQQFEGGISREDAAAIWQTIIDSLYVSAEEGPCCPIFQTDPATGLPEVSYDGGMTFEKFQQGEYDPAETAPYAPAPAPLNKGSESADKCQAAADAAAVLAEFWRETIATFAADLGNSLLAVNKFLYSINQALYRLVYPQEAQITKALGLFEFPWPDYYDTPTLSDDQIQGITCLMYDNATWTAGVVTFDYSAVYDGLPDAVGGINPGIALQLLLAYVQNTGLNFSGNVTAVSDPDCSECGTWCYNFVAAGALDSWTVISPPDKGHWDGSKWVGDFYAAEGDWSIRIKQTFTASTITRTLYTGAWTYKQVFIFKLSGATVATYDSSNPGHDGIQISGSNVWIDTNLVADEVQIFNTGDSTVNCSISDIQINGDGANPFGADNC